MALDALQTAQQEGSGILSLRAYAAGIVRFRIQRRKRAVARRRYHEGLRAAEPVRVPPAPDERVERVELLRSCSKRWVVCRPHRAGP